MFFVRVAMNGTRKKKQTSKHLMFDVQYNHLKVHIYKRRTSAGEFWMHLNSSVGKLYKN